MARDPRTRRHFPDPQPRQLPPAPLLSVPPPLLFPAPPRLASPLPPEQSFLWDHDFRGVSPPLCLLIPWVFQERWEGGGGVLEPLFNPRLEGGGQGYPLPHSAVFLAEKLHKIRGPRGEVEDGGGGSGGKLCGPHFFSRIFRINSLFPPQFCPNGQHFFRPQKRCAVCMFSLAVFPHNFPHIRIFPHNSAFQAFPRIFSGFFCGI